MKRRLKVGQVYSYTWGNGDEEIHLLLHELPSKERQRADERVWRTLRLDNGMFGLASFLLGANDRWTRLS